MFGWLADRYGHKLSLLTMSALLLIAAHGLLGFVDVEPAESSRLPVFGLVLFGVAMSIGAATLWPLVLLVVEPVHRASALGVASALDNGWQATSILVSGALARQEPQGEHHRRDQYELVSFWVLALALLMLLFVALLWHSDTRRLNAKPDRDAGDEEEQKRVSMQETAAMELIGDGDEETMRMKATQLTNQ